MTPPDGRPRIAAVAQGALYLVWGVQGSASVREAARCRRIPLQPGRTTVEVSQRRDPGAVVRHWCFELDDDPLIFRTTGDDDEERFARHLAGALGLAWLGCIRNGHNPGQHCGSRGPHADGAAHPRRCRAGTRAQVFAKLEVLNPGGSVKDRIGVAMIEAAEAEGRIEPGRTTIVEATSGNTGIALAFVCAAKGYDLILTLPQGMSREREGLLRLYGAQFQITESLGGMNEAVAAAQALARDDDVLAARPVLQPRQPRGALPRDRPGDLGGARRATSTASSPASAPAAR